MPTTVASCDYCTVLPNNKNMSIMIQLYFKHLTIQKFPGSWLVWLPQLQFMRATVVTELFVVPVKP